MHMSVTVEDAVNRSMENAKRITFIGRVSGLVACAVLFAAGCTQGPGGGGIGVGSGQDPDPATVDFPIFYVRHQVPEESDDVTRVRAHVTIPYNASVMSFFEHYWLGIPQFAPTPRFLLALQREGRALSQLTGTAFAPSPVARRGGTLPDPNDGRNVGPGTPKKPR